MTARAVIHRVPLPYRALLSCSLRSVLSLLRVLLDACTVWCLHCTVATYGRYQPSSVRMIPYACSLPSLCVLQVTATSTLSYGSSSHSNHTTRWGSAWSI